MGQDMLETAMGYIANLTGKAEVFKGLRAVFVSRIYVGRLTAEERAQVIAEVAARLRSRASAMILLGVDDPEAMEAEIEQEAPLPTPPENPNTPPKDKPQPGK